MDEPPFRTETGLVAGPRRQHRILNASTPLGRLPGGAGLHFSVGQNPLLSLNFVLFPIASTAAGDISEGECARLFRHLMRCEFNQLSEYMAWVSQHTNQFLVRHNQFLWRHCTLKNNICFNPSYLEGMCQRSPLQASEISVVFSEGFLRPTWSIVQRFHETVSGTSSIPDFSFERFRSHSSAYDIRSSSDVLCGLSCDKHLRHSDCTH